MLAVVTTLTLAYLIDTVANFIHSVLDFGLLLRVQLIIMHVCWFRDLSGLTRVIYLLLFSRV